MILSVCETWLHSHRRNVEWFAFGSMIERIGEVTTAAVVIANMRARESRQDRDS